MDIQNLPTEKLLRALQIGLTAIAAEEDARNVVPTVDETGRTLSRGKLLREYAFRGKIDEISLNLDCPREIAYVISENVIKYPTIAKSTNPASYPGVAYDRITCLMDNLQFSMMRRHILGYGITLQDYFDLFALPGNYPINAEERIERVSKQGIDGQFWKFSKRPGRNKKVA